MAEEPTLGRKVAAGAFGITHPVVAGKKGKKTRATVRSGAYTLGGSAAGGLAGAALTRRASGGTIGSAAGGTAGALKALGTNNEKGYYKPQKVRKSMSTSAFGVEHGEIEKGLFSGGGAHAAGAHKGSSKIKSFLPGKSDGARKGGAHRAGTRSKGFSLKSLGTRQTGGANAYRGQRVAGRN